MRITVNPSWKSANHATRYDLYLWKSSSTSPGNPTAAGLTTTMCSLAQSLTFATTYKWQVVARNDEGQTAGPIWTFTTASAPGDLYVDATAGSDAHGDGATANPFQTIGMALSVVIGSSTTPCAIHVAEGVYRETITMHAYENLYGGYRPSDWMRDPAIFVSTIDGESTRGCVVAANNAMLDGFTLRNGRAAQGGGIYADNASPIIQNCVIQNCAATNGGGAYFTSNAPVIDRCEITSCTASDAGGGIYLYCCASPSITNCLITHCLSPSGGGIFTYNSFPQLINCTLSMNQGGVKNNYISGSQIKNTIIWNNGDDLSGFSSSDVQYCDIEDGDYAGANGNISADPLFRDAALGDFHLVQSSPCIDTATSVSVPLLDLDGVGRPMSAGFDMGCYEWNPALPDRPTSPSPADGATTIAVTENFGWAACERDTNYDLYLWRKSEMKPTTATAVALLACVFDPPKNLENGTDYHWQVIAWNNIGRTPGPIWNFKTTQLYPLMVTVEHGSVTKSPDQAFYDYGSTVSLSVNPHTGYHFTSWIGDVAAGQEMNNPLIVTMDTTRTLSANISRNTGTVAVDVTPDTATWSFTDGDGAVHGGSGDATATGVPTGSITMSWGTISGYDQPVPNQVMKQLDEDRTVIFLGVFISNIDDILRHKAQILRYLLGLSSDPTGLNVNGDDKVDIADLVCVVESQAPTMPSGPQPADGATTLSVTTHMSWAPCQRGRSYDLYLWKSTETKPTTPTAAGLTTLGYDSTTTLTYSTTYLWQVVANNGSRQTPGSEWTFTTKPQVVIVIAPNGPDTWTRGTTAQIHWKTNTDVAGTAVRFEL